MEDDVSTVFCLSVLKKREIFSHREHLIINMIEDISWEVPDAASVWLLFLIGLYSLFILYKNQMGSRRNGEFTQRLWTFQYDSTAWSALEPEVFNYVLHKKMISTTMTSSNICHCLAHGRYRSFLGKINVYFLCSWIGEQIIEMSTMKSENGNKLYDLNYISYGN